MKFDAFEVVYAFDTDVELLPALVSMLGPEQAQRLHIGPSCGDLLQCDITQWERVDFVVAGPPCPPFSSMGLQLAAGPAADPRERVFQQVTNAIIHQGHLGCFGFIVEMVVGIAFKSKGQRSYYDTWLGYLRQKAPMFRIHCWPMQSRNYLPHNRIRLYTVGLHRCMVPHHNIAPPLPPASCCRPTLGELLHKGIPPLNEGPLTPQQRDNLAMVKPLVQQLLSGHQSPASGHTMPLHFQPPIACLEVDRNPRLTYGETMRIDDSVPCLRTAHEMHWLLKFNTHGELILSRALHPMERLALQGFQPELATFFSKRALLRATSNSFTVPVVTAVFQKCIVAAQEWLGPPPISRPLSHDLSKMMQLLSMRQGMNEGQDMVALLEAKAKLALRGCLLDTRKRVWDTPDHQSIYKKSRLAC